MFPAIDAPPIENTKTLEIKARCFIDAFYGLTGSSIPPAIDLEIRNGTWIPDAEDAAMHPPVVFRLRKKTPVLYLRSKDLVGRPASVMEGGLAMELAVMVLQQEPKIFRLNFERVILPMLNVSGSAVQFLRRLVMHLETALQRFKAVQLVIDAGYGEYLFYYYFHTFQPSDEDHQYYDNLGPHHWMRAMYLAQKSSVYMPLAPLVETGVASGLQQLWWDCHGYLMPEDHQFLAELAETPHRMAGQTFSNQIADMFRKIMDRFLS